MTEDEPKSKKEQNALSVLEMAKSEREMMEKAVIENKQLLEQLKELKAFDILSGKSEQGKVEPVVEMTPQEYAKRALEGKI